MKILVVSQFFYPESFLLNDFVKGLIDNGHQVVVLTGQPNYPQGKIYKDYSNFSRWKDEFYGATVLRVPVLPRGQGRARQLALNYLSFILSCLIFGLPRVLLQKFDVIFSWGTSPILQSIPALFIKFFKRRKTYLWVQDLWPETLTSVNMIESKFIIRCVGWVVSFIYKYTDYILVQSPAFKLSVMKYGGDEEKIHWIPNWSMVPQSGPKDTTPFHQFSPQHFNFLFAGNLGKAQSLHTLIEAAEILSEQTDIKINILGEGSEKQWLEKVCQKRKVENISFLSGRPMEEMPFYFDQCQALVVTLKNDDTLSRVIPSKIQTYLASGRPIVASVSGESQKILKESGAALVSLAEDPVALARNIKEIASYSDTKLSEMGLKGKSYYNAYFERKKVMTHIVRLFEEGRN